MSAVLGVVQQELILSERYQPPTEYFKILNSLNRLV